MLLPKNREALFDLLEGHEMQTVLVSNTRQNRGFRILFRARLRGGTVEGDFRLDRLSDEGAWEFETSSCELAEVIDDLTEDEYLSLEISDLPDFA